MLNEYGDTGTTISEIAGVLFGGVDNLMIANDFVQNAGTSDELRPPTIRIGENVILPSYGGVKLKFSSPSVQSTGASRKFSFGEQLESRMTQTLVYPRQQRLAFPAYNEEDIFYWDVSIVTPPPRPSASIRVKLRYRERSKPIPIEDPWAE